MGFLTGLIKTAVFISVTPLAVVKDIVDIARGYQPETTDKCIESTVDSFFDSIEDLSDGDLI